MTLALAISKGVKGDTGDQGPQGIQGEQGPQGIQGIQGETGATGATGPQGDQGIQGIQGIQGETGPQGDQGIQGIQGEQGVQGETGATGPQGDAGPTGATGPAGADGSDGADGKTWYSGSGAPSDGTGVDGDFYLDTTASAYYGPKAGGTWSGTGPHSIVGATGAQGPQGDTGATGPAGPGVPAGGTATYLLAKASGDDYDTEWVAPGTPAAHAASHTNGTDDIQDATSSQKGLATAAQITKLDGIATGADVTGSNPPQAHASSHQSGGSDAIKLDDLATPDDNTDLDVSTSAHGLAPKLPNDSTKYLNGVGSWAVPAGGSATYVPKGGNTIKVGYKDSDEITISAGVCHLDDDVDDTAQVCATAFDKSVGSLSANTWYFVYIDPDTDDVVAADEIQISSTAPTYDVSKRGWYHGTNTDWRCIGIFYSDASSYVLPFTTIGRKWTVLGAAPYLIFDYPTSPVTPTAGAWTAYTATAPLASIIIHGNSTSYKGTSGTGHQFLRHGGATGSSTSDGWKFSGHATYDYYGNVAYFEVGLDSSKQFEYYMSALAGTANWAITLRGFYYPDGFITDTCELVAV